MFGEEPIRPRQQTAISGRERPLIPCRVCRSGAARPFAFLHGLDYWRCTICEAVFLDAAALPPPDRELAHYMLHENDPSDPRYRRFLSRLGDPLAARLQPGSHGLDYGCGPGPALAAMLREQGHAVRTYDPFFEPDTARSKQATISSYAARWRSIFTSRQRNSSGSTPCFAPAAGSA